MVTNGRVDYDGYTMTVGLTGPRAGKVNISHNGIKLVKNSDDQFYVCPELNGWTTKK